MRIPKFVLLIILIASSSISSAQKAFEKVKYSVSLNGVTLKLSLADGYVVASKIDLLTEAGKRKTFTPESGVLENQKTIKFLPVTGHGKSVNTHFFLYGIEDSFTKIPSQILGTYYDGKKQYKIIFKKEK